MFGVVAEITDRRLSAKTVSKYQVTVDYAPDGTIARHYYPYYDVDTGELVAAKSRLVKDKDFHVVWQHDERGSVWSEAVPRKGKYVTITEGELDAMSVYEMFGQKYDVVSLRSVLPVPLRKSSRT